MTQNKVFEEVLVDKLHSSTSESTDGWNFFFRYGFLVFNDYGPQLVDEIHYLETLRHMYEPESEMSSVLKDISDQAKYVLAAAGSINGRTLDAFLVQRMRVVQQQQGLMQKDQGILGKLFGGGGGQPNPGMQ